MINLVYGGVYGLTLVLAFIIGYWHGKLIGTKEGRDSCAETAGQIINKYCCDDCIKRIKRFTSETH